MQSLLLLRLKKKKVRPLPLPLAPPLLLLLLPRRLEAPLLASLQPEPQDQLESSEVRNPSRIRSNFCVEAQVLSNQCQPRHSRDGHRRGLTQGL